MPLTRAQMMSAARLDAAKAKLASGEFDSDEAVAGAVKNLLDSPDFDLIRAAHPEPPRGWPENDPAYRRLQGLHDDPIRTRGGW